MSKNTEQQVWNIPDIYLVVTCGSNEPRFMVADVYANSKPGRAAGLWSYFSYGQYNKIGKVTMFKRDKGYIVRLKCANIKRFETFVTNEPGLDTIREILAGWVTGSESLSSLALATREV